MMNNQKTCNINDKDRVIIANNYLEIPLWKLLISFPAIYIPAITTLPFVFLSGFLMRVHLTFIGAKNLKKYKDFIPKRSSFRYDYKSQIVVDNTSYYLRQRLFWFYNCGIYCPYSVAIFEYNAYLTKIVENWWCPFTHDKKNTYSNAPIDKSYWHIDEDRRKKLHKDDLENPIWNGEK